MTIEIKCQSCGRLTECSTLLLSACPLVHCGWCGTPIERPRPAKKYQSYIEKLKEWIWSDDSDEEAPSAADSTVMKIPSIHEGVVNATLEPGPRPEPPVLPCPKCRESLVKQFPDWVPERPRLPYGMLLCPSCASLLLLVEGLPCRYREAATFKEGYGRLSLKGQNQLAKVQAAIRDHRGGPQVQPLQLEPSIESLADCVRWRRAFLAWMAEPRPLGYALEFHVSASPQEAMGGKLLIQVLASIGKIRMGVAWWGEDLERMSPEAAAEDVARGMRHACEVVIRKFAEDYR